MNSICYCFMNIIFIITIAIYLNKHFINIILIVTTLVLTIALVLCFGTITIISIKLLTMTK